MTVDVGFNPRTALVTTSHSRQSRERWGDPAGESAPNGARLRRMAVTWRGLNMFEHVRVGSHRWAIPGGILQPRGRAARDLCLLELTWNAGRRSIT